MSGLLADQPVLTLFVVAALGAALGRVRVRGVGLGVAGTVFAGLALSAAVPGAALPDVVTVLGVALFVFAVGLASGPTLRAALRGGGRRLLVLGALLLVAGGVVAALAAVVLDLDAVTATGVYAGALTNTPALATVVERLEPAAGRRAVVAFAVAYPVGMTMTLLATARLLAAGREVDDGELHRVTVRVAVDGTTVDALLRGRSDVDVVRVDRDGQVEVASQDTPVARGDQITLLGAREAVEEVVARVGGSRAEDAFVVRRVLDFRPVLVTRREVAGRSVGELRLRERHGARITRIGRGDLEWLATDDSRLELGDRVTLVAPPEDLDELAAGLGDSVRGAGEVDLFALGTGLAIGLALGALVVPLGPVRLQLGFAGGPLVAGLVLGGLVRTGPLLWQLPAQAAGALRQLGLALFLAGVGTNAGPAFVEAVGSPAALRWAVAALTVASVPLVGVRLLRRRLLDALGGARDAAAATAAASAGAATQPAALALVEQRDVAREDLLGYATLFPLGMVGKVVVAQLLVALL